MLVAAAIGEWHGGRDSVRDQESSTFVAACCEAPHRPMEGLCRHGRHVMLLVLMWLPAALVAVRLAGSFARPDLVAATAAPLLGATRWAPSDNGLD
jgi:hypothetical protein